VNIQGHVEVLDPRHPKHVRLYYGSGTVVERSSELTWHALGGLDGSRRTQMQHRAAGGRHDHHPESMTSYQKSDSANPCVFTWRTILPNFIPILLEPTEP